MTFGDRLPAGPSLAARLDSRSNGLNFLRLVLAATVIVSHAWPLGGFGDEPVFGGATPGTWAVFGFFALSGYLIAGSRLSNDLLTFLQHRILRIYPGFVVSLLATVLVFGPLVHIKQHRSIHGYLTTPTTPIDYVLRNVGLRMNVYHVAGTPYNVNGWTGSLWTLYYEFLCYLIIGSLALWALFRRRPAVSVAILVLATVLRVGERHVHQYAGNVDLAHMIELFPYFIAGTTLYMLRERIPARWWLGALSLVAVVVVPLEANSKYVVLCAMPLAYLLMYVGAVLPIRLGRRNDISYGVYIYGFPVQQILWTFNAQRYGLGLFIALSLICTAPLAVASWFLVERPAMRLRKRWASARSRPLIGSGHADRSWPAAEDVSPRVLVASDPELRRPA